MRKILLIFVSFFILLLIFSGCSSTDIELLKANRLAGSNEIQPRLQAYEIYSKYASTNAQARSGLLAVCKSLGISYTLENQFNEALKFLLQALEMDPTQYIAHYYAGVCYANLWANEFSPTLKEDYKQKALMHYQMTIEQVPSFTSAHYGLGFFYYQAMNDHKKAKEELEIVLKLDPKYVRAYFVLAQIAYLEGDLGLARDYYTKILSLLPSKDYRRQTVLDNIARIDAELNTK